MKKWIKIVRNWKWVRLAAELFERFGKHNGTLNAAGLAFFMLLTFAPMILAGVGVLSKVVTANYAIYEVRVMVDGLLPPGGPREEMNHFLGERLNKTIADLSRKGGVAGAIGLLTVLWTSMQIFVTGSTAMNAAFDVAENRSWIKLRMAALGLLLTSGALLLVSLFLSAFPLELRQNNLPIIRHVDISPFAIDLVFVIIAVMVNAVLFTMIYKYLPAAPNSWRSAAVGGLAASVLFETAKQGMAVFLLRPNHSLYGGLANLILFILWVYYSMTILLFGSEIAAMYARENEPHTVGHPENEKTLGERIRATARAGRRGRRS